MNAKRVYDTVSPLASSILWKRLNHPRFICAPMVEQSDLAFRLLVRKYGADMAYTEMIHAKNYTTVKKYRNAVSDWLIQPKLGENMELFDRPLIVQLSGHDPDNLVETGRIIQDSCDENRVAGIDLNLGCPQGIAKKGNYGAYLLHQRQSVLRCLGAMTAHLTLPISAKIRLLHPPGAESSADIDIDNTLRLCQDMVEVGVQLITIHARNLHGKKQFTGAPHWDALATIVREMDGKVPIVANGGVSTLSDALRCMEYTGAVGVMSSEGVLENPRLFCGHLVGSDSDINSDEEIHGNVEDEEVSGYVADMSRGGYMKDQLDIMDEYLTIVDVYGHKNQANTKQPSPSLSPNTVSIVKAHAFKLLFRMLSASGNWDVRSILANTKDYSCLVGAVAELRKRAERVRYSDNRAIQKGLLVDKNWYHRQR